MEPGPDNTPENNFQELWQTLDHKYTFFTFKNIDWDSVYNVYHPRISNDMSDQALFDVMSEMLFELRDGHVNLFTPFDISRNWEWYLGSPQNFNFSLLERNYLQNDYERSGPLLNKMIDSIGYIYCGSFGSTIYPENIDYVLKKFQHLKGIIIDVRDNGGGSTANSDRLASRFTASERVVYFERFKNGPGHDDFSEPRPKYLRPEGPLQFTKPVAVLTNRSSYSAANDFAVIMSALPHVTLIGDTTGGGGGYPYYSELPNGWHYRFSSSQTISVNDLIVEAGIPPDIQSELREDDEIRGIDTILERALEELK